MFVVARRVVAALLFVVNTFVPGPPDARPVSVVVRDTGHQSVIQRPIPKGGRKGALRFARTELYFGTAMPDGAVTDEEFRAFIDREVTPRFPDGLTVLEAEGQFRGADGILVKERSFVLDPALPVRNLRDGDQAGRTNPQPLQGSVRAGISTAGRRSVRGVGVVLTLRRSVE